MELWQLKYFLAVAEELNFGRAAQRLFVAQPSVTRAIQALEGLLGVMLLLRDKRGVALTPAGVAFVGEARAILARAEFSMRTVRRAALGEISVLNLGFEGCSALSFVPAAVSLFHQRYPEVVIEFNEMSSQFQIEALKKGAIDIGFVILPVSDGDVDIAVIAEAPLVVAMSNTHPLIESAGITLGDISGEQIIGRSEGNGCGISLKVRDVVGNHLGKPMLQIVDSHLRTHFIAAGFGLSILPASTAKMSAGQFTYRPLSPPASIQIAVARNLEHKDDIITRHFLHAVSEVLLS